MRPAGDPVRAPGPGAAGLPGRPFAVHADLAVPVVASGWRRKALRAWRVGATGAAFAAFGLGALFLALLVFPLCRATAGSRAEADARVQYRIHRGCRAFLRVLEALRLLRTRWVGSAALHAPGAKLVVANHPTLLDFVLLAAELPQADCVVSDTRAHDPFLALAARAAGYLPNTQGAALVDACARRLRAGRTLILFPEGTRSPLEGLQPLRRGAAHVALSSGAPIVPISIRCQPRTLMKGQSFWEVPARAPEFTLQVQEPLDPREDTEAPVARGVAARRLTARLHDRLAARSA